MEFVVRSRPGSRSHSRKSCATKCSSRAKSYFNWAEAKNVWAESSQATKMSTNLHNFSKRNTSDTFRWRGIIRQGRQISSHFYQWAEKRRFSVRFTQKCTILHRFAPIFLKFSGVTSRIPINEGTSPHPSALVQSTVPFVPLFQSFRGRWHKCCKCLQPVLCLLLYLSNMYCYCYLLLSFKSNMLLLLVTCLM